MIKRVFLLWAMLFTTIAAFGQTGSIQQTASLSGVEWGAGLPKFSYPFGSKAFEQLNGGRSKQVGSYNFPISTNMAGVLMELSQAHCESCTGTRKRPNGHT